jgi:hypothetical protein
LGQSKLQTGLNPWDKVSRPCKFCSLYNVLLPNSRSANIGDLKLKIRSVEYAEPKILLVLLNMPPFSAK